ncbi:uncharacterized protein LOC110061629 [Orbicella faveolata]|uniref:uncharacterized protein LOC110061629 n=1 Tax=Orbicella faveolata TaxID=48498 RepID=UPI0009E437E5|nr:uncharacterized protein LOC110061629 [Orbicella faveolata]
MSVWVRCYLYIVVLYASTKCQGDDCIQTMPHPKECIYQDDKGHKYDLTTIRNDNGTPRFKASDQPDKPECGYEYSFNPCISFTLGTSGPASDCQSDNDVAVCRSHDLIHRRIGKQSSVKFGRYKRTKIPMLHYCR